MRILVLDAGSSSLKASVIADGRTVARTATEWRSDATRQPDREAGVRAVLDELFVAGVPLGSIEAVGHRVGHGGTPKGQAVLIDDVLVTTLTAGDLAPVDSGLVAETISAARRILPEALQVAVFETAGLAVLSEEEWALSAARQVEAALG